jgi:hypothetical protein
MSVVIDRFIYCDDCGDNICGDDRTSSLKIIRQSRLDAGWVRRGRKDYCEVCSAKRGIE